MHNNYDELKIESRCTLSDKDYVECTCTFRIPADKFDEITQSLKDLVATKSVDFEEEYGDNELIPWREVYHNYHGGVSLRATRNSEGLSQKELAARIGVIQSNISEMESGKRPIGKNIAKRLAKVFNVDYKVFL